jgi:hypothetical protein
MAAIQAGWGNPQTPIPVARQLTRIFNMPTDSNDYDDWMVKAQNRFDAMVEAADVITRRPVDAQVAFEFVVGQGMPDELLDNHEAFVAFYKEVYLSDEWDTLSPLVQQAIHMLVELHINSLAVQDSQAMQTERAVTGPFQAEDALNQAAAENLKQGDKGDGKRKGSKAA